MQLITNEVSIILTKWYVGIYIIIILCVCVCVCVCVCLFSN